MIRLIASLSFLVMLAACAGTAPAPSATESTPAAAPSTPASAPAAEQPQGATPSATETTAAATASASSESQVLFNSQQLDNYRLATPENTPASQQFTATQAGTPADAQTTQSSQYPPDPYKDFPALTESVFA